MDSVILDTENLLLSPSNRAKLKAKNAALKLKNGSPKLKEVLRHRCRVRIKEKRNTLFNSSRNLSCDGTNEISSIVRQELQEIWDHLDEDSGFNSQSDDGSVEFNDAEPDEDWLMDEIDRIISVDDDVLEKMLEDKVICPLCQKGVLLAQIVNGMSSCNACGEYVPAPNGLEDLDYRIRGAVGNHAENCCSIPSFTKIQDGIPNLYILCLACSYFNAIF